MKQEQKVVLCAPLGVSVSDAKAIKTVDANGPTIEVPFGTELEVNVAIHREGDQLVWGCWWDLGEGEDPRWRYVHVLENQLEEVA